MDDLPSSNDPDISMSGILLFSKLISGRLLSEATVVVTSRSFIPSLISIELLKLLVLLKKELKSM